MTGRAAAANPVDRPCSRLVRTFADYGAAERAVDILVAQGFGNDELFVAGDELRLMGNTGDAGAATFRVGLVGSAVGGGLFGVVLALVFGFVGITDPIVSAGAITLWGAVVGALTGRAAIDPARRERREPRRAQPAIVRRRRVLRGHSVSRFPQAHVWDDEQVELVTKRAGAGWAACPSRHCAAAGPAGGWPMPC